MAHELAPLPYAFDALEPHIDAKTMEIHHGKHHAAYVAKLNKLIKGTEFADMPLEELVTHSSGEIFNNAAQCWNHTFFWFGMSPAPLIMTPFSSSMVVFWMLLRSRSWSPWRSATLDAMIAPLALYQGPAPMRPRALIAGSLPCCDCDR